MISINYGQTIIKDSIIQLPLYTPPTDTNNLLMLKMGYASAHISEISDNKIIKEKIIVKEIDLVYTLYPRRKQDWITDYDSLLYERKKSIIALLPAAGNKTVKWNLILQTSCNTEKEAKSLFHGAYVRYEIPEKEIVKATKPVTASRTIYVPQPVPRPSSMKDLVSGRFDFADSVVLKTLMRNQDWKDMVVVNDWTGSMYEYGAQVVLWHQLHLEKKAIKSLFFFNDGDKKKNHKKVIGKTGGIYQCAPDDLNKVIELMEKVMEKGDGGDIEENDMEALLAAIKKNKNIGELVLIADNKSHVRDVALLQKIKVPVRVILCGAYQGGVVLPEYLELARSTGGSIHTIEEDIFNMADLKEGAEIEILKAPYTYRNGRFERVRNKKVSLSAFEEDL